MQMQLRLHFVMRSINIGNITVLQPDPTRDFADDLEQMIKDRIPRITLALTVGNMLDYEDLC